MKRLFFLAALFTAFSCGGGGKVQPDPTPDPTPTPEPEPEPEPESAFVKGADISWASEMEAGGIKFKKKDGTQAALLDVLKDCGFNAVRLRVWVDPYEGWSGKEDVVAMAKKVKAAGMDLMIDFHYSDFFADPSRQLIPSAWQADKDNLDKLCQHVAAHTVEVLQALKDAGVTVKWVQVGNETREGMLFPAGQAVWKNDRIDLTNFVKLYNAGYEAAKAIYPDAYVMPHLNSAFLSASYGNPMWLDNFKAKGGNFDMIAFSHYPHLESKMWIGGTEKTLSPSEVNQYAIAYIKKAVSDYGVPVMIAEVGVKQGKSDAASVLSSFLTEVKKIDQCAGVFYWEPQVNGSWKPSIYEKPAELTQYTGKTVTSPWGAYDQGAFSADYKPTNILDCFAP